MVILKLGLQNEEVDLRIMNIIGSSIYDVCHVPITDDGIFNGAPPNDTCLL